jgi:ATP-dependent helicase/nuclease subunit A
MAQKKIKWTTQQSRAVVEHGRNVFVSASAGTGKTAVLSGSCVDVVTNPSACPDVFSVLVVTFTDMAAEQMRSRIAQQLNSAIESITDPAVRRHLRRQLIFLGAADISTIHSFCKRQIAEHFYKLDLDPTFAILDADEAKLLKAEALEKTIDYAWKQQNVAEALQQLLVRRDLRMTDGFPATVIEISDFLEGIVSREDWLRRAQILAEATDPFATDLAQSQRQIITEKLQDALGRLEFALKIYTAQNPSGQWAAKCKNEYIDAVQQCLDRFKAGQWEFERPRVSRPTDVSQADFIAGIVGDALDDVRRLKDIAILNPEYLGKFAGAVSQQTRVLIELVRQFGRFYSQAKRTINCLDFADLEHYALRLLTAEEKRGQESFLLGPSQTALSLREKYKYVFVDECQDINGVQQAILDMLSPPGSVFAVGDPKQSIYQWRGAQPEIFLERLNRASSKPGTAEIGLRVDLNINFRSVKPVLDFVNSVFSRIMTASFTNIDYDESAHLRPASADADAATLGPACPEQPVVSNVEPSRRAVELHVLDKAQAEPNTSALFNDRQLQAAMVARRIKQMVVGDATAPALQILDKKIGSSRPVEYRDIVILMRSLAGKGDFLEVLRLSGVPVSCEATAGYFEATEITDMLCLLKVLDNPRRDIEFAAVLRSPFFRLTDTELAKIRLCGELACPRMSLSGVEPLFGKKDNHKPGFYDCVLGCQQLRDDRDLADKLDKALATLDDWRTVARRGRLAELIWHIYRQSGLLSFVSALPDGPARRANLLKLHDRAIQFETFASNTGVPSLTRFIEFVEKLLAAGQDWSPAEPESAAGNAVRVLSVHKSKGLEFPVVFIADLDSQFSKKDSKRDCLVDEQSTLGLRIIDADTNSRLDSLGFQVIEEHARHKSLAEEMRILYVAMTRAIDRLVLVGGIDKKNCQNILTASSFFDGALPHWRLSCCKSHLDWLLSALGNQPILHKTFQTGLSIQTAADDLFDVRLYTQPELEKLSALIRNTKRVETIGPVKSEGFPGLGPRNFFEISEGNRQPVLSEVEGSAIGNPKNLAHLKESLNWRYPFGDAPLLPAKRSVTQFTHRNDEFTKLDYSASLGRKPKAILITEQIDGRSIGLAAHLVLSQLDLDKPVTTEIIKRLIDKLVADDAIAQPVASCIDVDSIMKFFQTDLGQMTLNKNNSVFREWPFTFALPASQWLESPSLLTNDERRTTNDDSIIIQGIIDLLIQTPKGLVIVDFKTDNVPADKVSQRAELYRRQLDLYAQAASAITGQKTLSKWLYFLGPAREVEI